MCPDGPERKLAAILSADVVGYSRLLADDEAATIRRLTDYREAISMLVRQHRGRVVDSPGDNLLAEFPTALDSVQAAVEIQRVIGARNADLPAERQMDFRIGVHLGDIAVEGERVYGDGVNVAARLEGLAQPGGVCISDMVYNQVEKKLSVDLEDLGEQTLKNISRPVRVYGVKLLIPKPDTDSRDSPHPVATKVAELELPDQPSIAVLPFANMSGDPEQDYFSDGISEDLITDLSRISGLFVIARNSSFVYKGRPVSVPQVGRELGVRYVLEGSVRKANDRVRITAQLVDATTGGHVWAERYDRKLEDIFALQDEVTAKIVDALEVNLTQSEETVLRQSATQNLEAWDCFIRGHSYLVRFSQESNQRAREMYERAIALDPQFGWAHSALAWTYLTDWSLQWSDDPGTPERAFEIARRALELGDPAGSAHSLLSYARSYAGEDRAAIAEAEKAIVLNPNGAAGYMHLAIMLINAGRSGESIALLKRAMRLDPRISFMYLTPLGEAYRRLGRHKEAIDALNQALSGNPDHPYAHLFLAGIYADTGEPELARREASEVLRTSPRFSLKALRRTLASDHDSGLAAALRKAGLPEE